MVVAPVFYDVLRRSTQCRPDQTAIEVGDQVLTFDELHGLVRRRADQLADTAPDARAVLVARDGLATIVDHLALNAAGITVVPVHADGPARVQRVIDMTDAAIVIDHSAAPPGDPNAWRGLDAHTMVRARPVRPAEPEIARPPIILFTSGSTGRPKGVPIRAESLATYLAFATGILDRRAGDRCSHTFSLAFDLSMMDLYVTWSGGATVVTPSPAEKYNPIAYIGERELNHWASVPAAVDLARRAIAASVAGSGLRVSAFCGEELKAAQVIGWSRLFPTSRILNLYGPTEVTIACTGHEVDRDTEPTARIPIGTPNPGTECLVLPDEGGSVTRGELCVRGPQRFDGYLDENDNVGRFVDENGWPTHAANPVPERMFYRTGDIVTVEDGVYTYRGRIDNMVKIRGYRVELGELETVARAAAHVREAAAVAVPSPIGDTLALFIVGDLEIEETTVRAALAEALPRYMMPKEIHIIDQLPSNSNGKLDRSALAEWSTGGSRRD